jgi:uncharacterized protein (DUF58 family)
MLGVLVVFSIFSPSRPVMFVTIVVAGVVAGCYFWARHLSSGIAVERARRYEWRQVGDVIQERFVLNNDAYVPLLWAEVRDFSNLPGYAASRGIGLGARASTQWTTAGICRQRGVYTLGPLRLITGDPFGLFRVEIDQPQTQEFVVYPSVAHLPTLVTPHGQARGSARASRHSIELTTPAGSVRPYVPGDALNRIHWRSTARHSHGDSEQLLVKDFDLEPSGDLWILLDLDAEAHAGQDIESTEEYAVVLAASLTDQMLRDNQSVGLITHTDHPIVIPPQRSYAQLWEILRVLADAHALRRHPLGRLFAAAQPSMARGISAAIITPSADPAWVSAAGTLLRQGVHCTALLIDAASFGGAGQTTHLAGALADIGISSHVIGRGFHFEHLADARDPARRPGAHAAALHTATADWRPLGMSEEG